VVVAEFAEPEYTYWMLRWGLQENNGWPAIKLAL
jgi:hypothetical protein